MNHTIAYMFDKNPSTSSQLETFIQEVNIQLPSTFEHIKNFIGNDRLMLKIAEDNNQELFFKIYRHARIYNIYPRTLREFSMSEKDIETFYENI